jgi:hypothetical protein
MKLIAKDGIYLEDAPRAVPKILLASGNRADVLVGCKCTQGPNCSATFASNVWTPASMASVGLGFDAAYKRTYKGPIFSLKVRTPSLAAAGSLPELLPLKLGFERPCYVADLTAISEDKVDNHEIGFHFKSTRDNDALGMWGDHANNYEDMFDHLIGGFYNISWDGDSDRLVHEHAGPRGTIMMGSVQQWTILPPAINYHPFHQHVQPFQIKRIDVNTSIAAQFVGADDSWKPFIEMTRHEIDTWYKIGDWHDTLMTAGVPLKAGTGTDPIFRFVPLLGPTHVVIHCHWLQHEDQGMMMYLKSEGNEADAMSSLQNLTGCINSRGSSPR